MKLIVMLMAVIWLIVACGGGSDEGDDRATQQGNNSTVTASATPAPGVGGETTGDDATSGGGADLTPIGPVAVNTIQIGDQAWQRTLPMTSGQCFLYEDDGVLPTSATVWGTLDGDDDIRFSASFRQDGTFESEVQGDSYFWIAGPRSPGVDDLEIELDFDTLTVTGEGTFSNLINAEVLPGSFHFQCEPEDQ